MLSSRGSFLALAVVLALFVNGVSASAQAFVEHLEPPALERGKTTRVTLVGSQLGKSVGLWTSLPAGAVKATPIAPFSATHAVLDVTVAANAPVGICGVRLATVDGLANACLLLIDDLPVRPSEEQAGRERPRPEPARVKLPVALWGRFREAVVDRFAIDVSAGQRVSFEAVGNRLGKDIDPLITIRDAHGKIVAERDNDAGLYFDFRFEHTFATPGTYTVELRDARFHGSEHGFYVLRMGKFPGARVALPTAIQWSKRFGLRLPGVEPLIPDRSPTEQEKRFALELPDDATGLFFGVVKRQGDDGSAWLPMEASDVAVTAHQSPGDSFADGTPAKAPGMWCGILQKPGERHYFRVELSKNQRIQVRAEARAFNSPADLEIAVVDAQGKELRRAGENLQTEEIVLDFTASAAGVYGLTVRDANHDGGPAFGYRLDVRTPRPMVQLTADVEGLTVPQGDYQTVPLTVTRTDYPGPIALSLVGAPPGVTLTPNEIGVGVNAIVCKLAAGPDAPLGIHTLHIRAEPGIIRGEPGASATGVATWASNARTRPLIDRQIVNVDLIPHALREDQLRLPPSLTDRFALQVTPPAAFTFELPEPLATLGRYQHVDFPMTVNRKHGFTGPITFSARGGQLAAKEEGRTRVYAEFTEGTGSIHSKILTNLAKHRVDVTALGVDPTDGRRVALTRTFDLDVRTAYVVSAEPAAPKLEPGATARLRWTAERMKNFDAEVTVALELSPALGIELPAKIVIPRGQASVEVDVKVDANQPAGRRSINWNATAVVNGLEEEQRGRLDIDIVKKEK
jgi:hypothetical protein